MSWRLPAYRLHKQFGPAIVTLSGKGFLLGTHSTESSRKEYDQLIPKLIAHGRLALKPNASHSRLVDACPGTCGRPPVRADGCASFPAPPGCGDGSGCG